MIQVRPYSVQSHFSFSNLVTCADILPLLIVPITADFPIQKRLFLVVGLFATLKDEVNKNVTGAREQRARTGPSVGKNGNAEGCYIFLGG